MIFKSSKSAFHDGGDQNQRLGQRVGGTALGRRENQYYLAQLGRCIRQLNM
jgi:hypothetical protein